MKINRIVGVIPLYQPKKQDFPNILKYINDLDYCFLLDDTGKDNSFLCKEIVDVNPDKIQYVCNTENIGLCASVNNGFKLAKEKNADWVLIMNPDGTFQNDAVNFSNRDDIITYLIHLGYLAYDEKCRHCNCFTGI